MLSDVWATMDGIKLTLQQSGTYVIQDVFYNGWTYDHYVMSVVCLCPDGTIPIAFFNVPGCVHDSLVADYRDIYTKLEREYEKHGGKCTVDSAFGGVQRPYLIKLSQDNLFSDLPTQQERNEDVRRKIQATSMRQAAEWGMRMLQGSFPRLKDRFVFEKRGERRIAMRRFILLFNLWSRLVGINQIRNVYMPLMERSAMDDLVIEGGEGGGA